MRGQPKRWAHSRNRFFQHGRHLDADGGFAVNWSLEEGADEVNLFNLTSKLGGLGKKHANGMKRSGRRPGVFHGGLTLEITMCDNLSFEFVKGAVRLDLAAKSFHKGSYWVVDDFSGVNDGKIKNLGVDKVLELTMNRSKPGFPCIWR